MYAVCMYTCIYIECTSVDRFVGDVYCMYVCSVSDGGIFCLCVSILVAESYSGSRVSFLEETSANLTITSSTWEPLEQLFKGEVRSFVCMSGMYACMYETMFARYTGLASLRCIREEEVRGVATITQ